MCRTEGISEEGRILARIAGFTTLYLFFFSVIVVFLPFIASLQGFLLRSLLLLLDILEWALFVFCVSDLYYGVFSLVRITRGGKVYAAPVAAFFGLVYGLGLLIVLNLLYSWFFW